MAQEAPPADDAPTNPPAPAGGAAAPAGENAMNVFDANGDGKLGADELGRARALFQDLRRTLGDGLRGEGPGPRVARDGKQRRPPRAGGPGEGGPRGIRGGPRRGPGMRPSPGPGGPEGDRPEGAGPEGAVPPQLDGSPDVARNVGQGQGPPRQRGPRPLQMFEEFDGDSSGTLSREEFVKLMGAMRERRGAGGPPQGPPNGPPEGGRNGRRRFGGGPDGPQGEGGPRREFGQPSDEGRPGRRGGERGRDFGAGGPPEGFQGEGPQGPPRGNRRGRGGARGQGGPGGPGGQRPPRDFGAAGPEGEFGGAPEIEAAERPSRPGPAQGDGFGPPL